MQVKPILWTYIPRADGSCNIKLYDVGAFDQADGEGDSGVGAGDFVGEPWIWPDDLG